MNWIKNNPIKSILIALVAIYVIVSLIKKQWMPWKWFAASGTTITRTTTTTEKTEGDGSAPFSDTLDALKKSLGKFEITAN